jgi:hypothetical protein
MAAALAEHPQAPAALARALGTSRGGSFAQTLAALARLAEGVLASSVADAIREQGPELSERLAHIASGAGGDPEHLRASALVVAALVAAPGAIEAAIEALGEQALATSAQRALSTLGAAALPALIQRIAPSPIDIGLLAPPPVSDELPLWSGSLRPPALNFPAVEVGHTDRGAPAEEPSVIQLRAAAIDAASAIALENPKAARAMMPELLTALRTAARGKEKDVATSALYAIAHIGSEEDLTFAAELALSPTVEIASSAEAALTVLAGRYPRAARALCAELTKREPLSLAAAILLGAIGASAAFDAASLKEDFDFLSNCTAAGDARTRRAAVMAVAQIGGPLANDVLSFALADEERDVQLAAARALGRLCSDPSASRFGNNGPPSGPPSSDHRRRMATDVLELIGRSGDSDLVAAAVSAFGDGMTTWSPPSMPPSSGRGSRASMLPSDDLIAALTPLASKAQSSVALAAVDALSRAPAGTPGRISGLLGALGHSNAAVTKAALLKLDVTDTTSEKIARCLEHPMHDVRLLTAERLASATGATGAIVRERLAKRAAVEPNQEVRDAIERAIASLDRREGGPSGT